MENYEELLGVLLEKLAPLQQTQEKSHENDEIPVGISNRHVHLAQGDVDKLFGRGYQLTKLKDLSQPGQYACKEQIMLAGPKGVIQKVRILGPVRNQSQVEILQSDSFKLGIKAPLRLSGDLAGSAGATLIGPNGSVELQEGVIVAKRHIHMLPEQARRFGVTDGEEVTINFAGPRGGSLHHVVIRAVENSGLECHIDTEEANALGVTPNTKIVIQKN
ncbi:MULTISPECIES: phosphate propanoyltransferase [unclassified Enterococcus]|uniref:phosphate propanoyltransferase n=1 Tax=unclassified Enterococcus TaxID=2608891 RepID=UPI001A9BFCD3|nr:phosphate propanoyltransferase [Enterococcus sp. DIV1271a]MBO1300592.1 phosphate propanoyltransferase [Enterococcus sp. DIV1271a]